MTSEQLRMARALLRIGVRELAAMAGVSKTTVVRFEAGGKPHASVEEKLQAALQSQGVIFIGAVEPFHGPTVAMRWGMQPPTPKSDDDGDEAGDENDDGGHKMRAWDETDDEFDDDEKAAMFTYWTAPERWNGLSQESRKAFTRFFGKALHGDEPYFHGDEEVTSRR